MTKSTHLALIFSLLLPLIHPSFTACPTAKNELTVSADTDCQFYGYNCRSMDSCTYQTPYGAISVEAMTLDWCASYLQGGNSWEFSATIQSRPVDLLLPNPSIQVKFPIKTPVSTLAGFASAAFSTDGSNAYTFSLSYGAAHSPLMSIEGTLQGCYSCLVSNGGCFVSADGNSSYSATCSAGSVVGQVECQCPAGFSGTGVGLDCEPINPCLTANGGCDRVNGICTYTGPGKNVCSCKTGYAMTAQTNACLPINNCNLTSFGGCDSVQHGGVCIFTGPGTNNCSCQAGYEMDATTDRCSPINNCLNSSLGGCDVNAACVYTGPGKNSCKCNSNYEGSGLAGNCTGINECRKPGICDTHASCNYTGPGTFSCICTAGYELVNSSVIAFPGNCKKIEASTLLGLSKEAFIGVFVGCGIFLVGLIGLLCWFFLKNNRKDPFDDWGSVPEAKYVYTDEKPSSKASVNLFSFMGPKIQKPPLPTFPRAPAESLAYDTVYSFPSATVKKYPLNDSCPVFSPAASASLSSCSIYDKPYDNLDLGSGISASKNSVASPSMKIGNISASDICGSKLPADFDASFYESRYLTPPE